MLLLRPFPIFPAEREVRSPLGVESLGNFEIELRLLFFARLCFAGKKVHRKPETPPTLTPNM